MELYDGKFNSTGDYFAISDRLGQVSSFSNS
jgi:hypothetical protein